MAIFINRTLKASSQAFIATISPNKENYIVYRSCDAEHWTQSIFHAYYKYARPCNQCICYFYSKHLNNNNKTKRPYSASDKKGEGEEKAAVKAGMFTKIVDICAV